MVHDLMVRHLSSPAGRSLERREERRERREERGERREERGERRLYCNWPVQVLIDVTEVVGCPEDDAGRGGDGSRDAGRPAAAATTDGAACDTVGALVGSRCTGKQEAGTVGRFEDPGIAANGSGAVTATL